MNLESRKIDIIKWYEQDNESTYCIAEKLGTYPNKVRRALKKWGVKLKDKRAAQKAALDSGRHTHPTKGKQRSEETRIKISESVHQHWQDMDDAEREKRSEMARQQWDSMTEEEREQLRKAAGDAVRKASKEGSKMEKHLKEVIEEAGYKVLFHQTSLIANHDLEIDLFIPILNTVIEIDGPAHFFPIWGMDSLKRHQKADAHKTGLLLGKGYAVIRVKHLTRSLTEKHKRDVANAVLDTLQEIDKKFPAEGKRLIELEVA